MENPGLVKAKAACAKNWMRKTGHKIKETSKSIKAATSNKRHDHTAVHETNTGLPKGEFHPDLKLMDVSNADLRLRIPYMNNAQMMRQYLNYNPAPQSQPTLAASSAGATSESWSSNDSWDGLPPPASSPQASPEDSPGLPIRHNPKRWGMYIKKFNIETERQSLENASPDRSEFGADTSDIEDLEGLRLSFSSSDSWDGSPPLPATRVPLARQRPTLVSVHSKTRASEDSVRKE